MIRRYKSPFLTPMILLVCATLFTSCMSKRPRTPEPLPPPQPQSPVISKTPVTPTPETPAPSPTPIPEPEKKIDGPSIALVLGGAGVASFATVGLLKRFQEEGIHVEYIVTTGWPTLFALGHSFLKSVHDLEWFAMRLQEKDFYKAGLITSNEGYSSHENLTSLVQNTFKQRELGDGRIPVIISATNTEFSEPDTYDRGDWKTPLLKTMSVPGFYRPYPHDKGTEWIQSLQGIDVTEAISRGAKYVVAVNMYEDYFRDLKSGGKEPSDKIFRKLYLAQLKKTIERELKKANTVGTITLGSPPVDFSSKRTAVFAGYKEGARLARVIRSEAQK